MLHITTEVAIDRPADEVFAFLADAANNPTWQAGMQSCVWLTDPPIAVGSRYEQRAAFLGKSIESTFEVTHFEAGRRITIATIESTFPIEVTRSVEPRGAGCVARAEVSGDPSGVFRIAAPLMKRMVKRSVKGDYARLKAHLEG